MKFWPKPGRPAQSSDSPCPLRERPGLHMPSKDHGCEKTKDVNAYDPDEGGEPPWSPPDDAVDAVNNWAPAGQKEVHGTENSSPESMRPARVRMSSFGDDEELAQELPPQWNLRKFQERAKSILNEFFVAMDVPGALAQARDLLMECPCEADELGVLAIRSALDHGQAVQEATVRLLVAAHGEDLLDSHALIRSYEKLLCTWEDIAIDAPKAPEALLQMLHGCIEGKAVGKTFLTKLPENLLSAGTGNLSPDMLTELTKVSAELKDFKYKVGVALQEYFGAGNVADVESFLQEIDLEAYHHEFVKKAATLSFTQDDAEAARESVVELLSKLNTATVLSKDSLQWGVTRLLGQLDDLELDCPRVVDMATELLSCLVADELVSVPFLRRCRQLRIGGTTGVRVLNATMRRTPEYSKKHLGTSQFKTELQNMILEYFNSGDQAEFARCVCELAPLSNEQSSELVRKVMLFAMERSGAECELALQLLVHLCRQEEIDGDHVEGGFDELYERMPDVMLDVPDAREMALSFVVEAKKALILRDDWEEPKTST